MRSPEQVLHEVFGFPSFRGQQEGIVRDVSRLQDIDQITPGDQYGHYVTIDGLTVLFANAGGWAQAAVVLAVPQSLIDLGDDCFL